MQRYGLVLIYTNYFVLKNINLYNSNNFIGGTQSKEQSLVYKLHHKFSFGN